ncbi:hypothetical protein C7S18_18880 [Ahniella affigens]|uniref:Uncharacterized protein n=1 Tax=Ahniella affigens TaxID=2021234 RepID=A0A2P1PW99_9GAMM|nr:hypothetical protein [Ahniella affigens]AVP99106.1 hypothetical protein C7S18_18880 [Ahniella affigens]
MTDSMRGRILFEVAYTDSEFQVPIITTLIDLDTTEMVEGVLHHLFLAHEVFARSNEPEKLVMLTSEQIGRLIHARELAELASRFATVVPREYLDRIGV